MNELKMKNNEPCKTCGGSCCKQMGCHLHPDDIKNGATYESIKEYLDSGNYSIDWWEGYGEERINGYYLRTRNVNSSVVDPSWGGQCVLLTEDGCSLSYKDRPLGGKSLIAREDMKCNETNFSKFDAANAWFKYYKILEELRYEYAL